MTAPLRSRSVLLVALLASLAACGGDGGGPSPGGSPSPAGEAAAPSAGPVVGSTSWLAEMLAALDERRADGDLVAVIPRVPAEVVAAVKERKMRVHPLRDRHAFPDYYHNQLIPALRNHGEGKLWLVFDHAHPNVVASLERTFLRKHRVPYRERFGTVELCRVLNEFPDDAGPAGKRLTLDPLPIELKSPITGIDFAGGLMLVGQKSGRVTWHDGTRRGTVLRYPRPNEGDACILPRGEGGLTGLCVHPDFPDVAKIYVQYNWQVTKGTRESRIAEWVVDVGTNPTSLTARDERVLLKVPQEHDNHNAGQLAFGPDGMLYIAVGDGEIGEVHVPDDSVMPRSPAGLLRGKILRIDVSRKAAGQEYAVPADNPFVGDDRFPPETWAWGFRNPWRFSFLPDGRIIAGDIGHDLMEELTFVKRGAHHGWPYVEGSQVRNRWPFDDHALQPALFPYGRDLGTSVIAGYHYEGGIDWMRGRYVFADYLSGRILMFDVPDGEDAVIGLADVVELGRWPQLMTTFGKDGDGELYIGTHTGRVLRVVEGAQAPTPATLDAASLRGLFASRHEVALPKASDAQISLGRELYSDVRLSANGEVSCATCHDPSRFGQNGESGPGGRNVPSTFNAKDQFAQMWDGRVEGLDDAVRSMLEIQHGLKGRIATGAKAAGYADRLRAAFPKAGSDERRVVRALTAFVAELHSPSRWDRFLDGDDAALRREELAGAQAFVSVGCAACHLQRGLGGTMFQKLGVVRSVPCPDPGRGGLPGHAGLEGYFKVPPLLNVAKTAPYYHDGSQPTLAGAIRHMAEVQLNRELTDDQVDAMVAFFGAMTGEKPAVLK